MISPASTATTASGLRALAASQPAPSPTKGQPALDEFQASSPDKHKLGFEAAYTAASAVSLVGRGAARVGQVYALAGGLAGLPGWSLSGPLALAAGTIDVAVGASKGRQAAVNRDGVGALQGNLQLAQGLATYAAVAAPALGAPPAVGLVAGGLAAAALVGRLGVAAYDKIQDRNKEKAREAEQAARETPAGQPTGPSQAPTVKASQAGSPQLAGKAEAPSEDPSQIGDSRRHEKAFAFSQANDTFFRGVGGMGAFWTNLDVIRGNQPNQVFEMLGVVGGTYSFLTGISATRSSAVNRNTEGTVSGALQTVQGAASVAAAMGMGRPAAIVAAGAWVANTAWGIYNQVKAVAGDKAHKEKATVAPPSPTPAPPKAPEEGPKPV